MATIINADTSNGLKLTSDTSGQIDFQSAGSTKATIDTSGNLKFDSGFGSAGVAYGVRAWIQLNGTGTIAIKASGNVSSITDNGTGDYTVNFATNMPDANYNVTYGTKSTGGGTGFFMFCKNATQSTSAVDILTIDEGTTQRDSAQVSVTILR